MVLLVNSKKLPFDCWRKMEYFNVSKIFVLIGCLARRQMYFHQQNHSKQTDGKVLLSVIELKKNEERIFFLIPISQNF